MPDSGGLVQKNTANVTSGKHIHNYSTFDRSLSYRLYNTLRFGDYTPSFNMEGVPTDEIQLNSLDRIDSLSLNAPFKGSIRKIKESFMIPNMAILPMQWDRIYAQNSNGDDVPADANCILESFPDAFTTLFGSFLESVSILVNTIYGDDGDDDNPGEAKSSPDYAGLLTQLLRLLVLGEYVFSSGSLLNVCGYKANGWIRFDVRESALSNTQVFYTFDRWFDKVVVDAFSGINSLIVSEPVGDSQRQHLFYGLAENAVLVGQEGESFRAMLELFRENPLCTIDRVITADGTGSFDVSDLYLDFHESPTIYIPSDNAKKNADFSDDLTELNPTTLNLSRLLAYQLVCAHYYTNSSIDFIYSAELYRQYIKYLSSLFFADFTLAPSETFTWNGVDLQYDYLSGHLLQSALCLDSGGLDALDKSNYNFLAVWAAIFGFRKSLRYGDYFTASRPRPLAPINTDVAVNNNMVSVVDVTRNIQAQRFANSVMRTRSKIEEYVKSLFNRAPAPDYHNPFFLARTEEMIFGDEVQNTAESQITNPNSRTANFASNISPYTFTFHNDDAHPCIYVQIISFDIKRAYSRSVERHFLHRDRFDMFNPDFQYIGDQPIYGVELGYHDVNDQIPEVFAYTTRDMEYKQRFDQASGGFVENLPGWCLTDQDRSRVNPSNLDPDFIRSYNTELDQFYLSLTGFSLGSYFHFTCITDNNVNAHRPMAVDPQILA